MNEIIPFAFGDNLVRVFRDENGDPWWVAKDVCAVLDLSNPTVVVDALEEDERAKFNLGRQGEANIINESGLYSLIFRSRKPEAREFRRWVTHEVLPSIRKTGRYAARPSAPPENLALDMENLPEEIRQLKPRLRERCLDLALQTCRLTGRDDQESLTALFIDYCRVIGSPNLSAPADSGLIGEYIQGRLIFRKGSSLKCMAVYDDFCRWWAERGTDSYPPGNQLFGRVMRQSFRKFKRSTNYYLDVAFKAQA